MPILHRTWVRAKRVVSLRVLAALAVLVEVPRALAGLSEVLRRGAGRPLRRAGVGETHGGAVSSLMWLHYVLLLSRSE